MKSRSLIKRNILCIFYMGKCKMRAKSCSASGREWMCLISHAVCSCARQIKVISCCCGILNHSCEVVYMLLSDWAFNHFLGEKQYKVTKITFVELTIIRNLNHPLLMFCSFLVCTKYENPTSYFTRAKKPRNWLQPSLLEQPQNSSLPLCGDVLQLNRHLSHNCNLTIQAFQ